MTKDEEARFAKMMAERDIARRDVLSLTIHGELRARGVTDAAAKHLARSFDVSTHIEEDGTLKRAGKTVTAIEVALLAAEDAKLLGSSAFEPGRAPKAHDGKIPIHQRSVNELFSGGMRELDANRSR